MNTISDCCGAEMIPPDEEAAEEAGSLCWAYLCYICKECGKACAAVEKTKNKTNVMENKKLYLISTIDLGDFYVVAENMTMAQLKVENMLNSDSYVGFCGREITTIQLLSTESVNDKGEAAFNSRRRLVF